MSHLTGKQEELPYSPQPIDPEKVAELQAAAPSEALIAQVARTFQTLSHPTRLKIL
ncbi:hypothetical protein EI42_04086 [Thermosporothrix hazakensis]|jgi:hypothetical protein|uniref:Uncharacterized protein n=1 Tax=Thermosporothrix hazakensis TaxID=644383 RepID=A0A326U4M6_THEHA|nr:hypothetical protein [Thermosporothrix hazakensis]PZW26127.1 hypothetical protein EI42_04086 [Thermosporothrix hazakensis]GCE51386.1 hypothetical protein KTH_62550 [Thermosporothrix hazakensis]